MSNRESIFQVSDLTSREFLNSKYKNDKNVIFFTNNEILHGDIFLDSYLYTYLHDIDYNNNTIYNDKFTCRLTRDRENHSLQLTYIDCNMDEITFFVYNDENVENSYTSSYNVEFNIKNAIKNLINDTDEGQLTAKCNIPDISLTKTNDITYTITCNRHSAIEDNIIFTFVHNGQNYDYKLPIKCIEVDAPCEDIVLYPKYSYLYEGQTQEFIYYTTPKVTTDEIITYNIPLSYHNQLDIEHGQTYDVAYVTCNGHTAYSYIYMIEPKLENIKLYLYYTISYLVYGQEDKINTTIYPPEVLSYVYNDGQNFNISFSYKPQASNTIYPIDNSCLSYNIEDNLIYLNTYHYSSDKSGFCTFKDQNIYTIYANISYKGQDITSEIIYPVGIEPKKCSSIEVYPQNVVCNSKTEYDTSNVNNTANVYCIRKYNGLDFSANNGVLQNSVQQQIQIEYPLGELVSFESYTGILDGIQYSNGFSSANGYKDLYVQKIAFKTFDDIENGTEEELTVYANDGSHLSDYTQVTVQSNKISPVWNNTFKLYKNNVTVETVSSNVAHEYQLRRYYTNSATSFNDVSWGENSTMNRFNCFDFGHNTSGNDGYAYFKFYAKSYIYDNQTVSFIIGDDEQNKYSTKIHNDISLLDNINFECNLTYLGVDKNNWIAFCYGPNMDNVTLDSMNYTNFNNDVSILVHTPHIQSNSSGSKIYYNLTNNNKEYNTNYAQMQFKPVFKQNIGNGNFITKEFTTSTILNTRRATIKLYDSNNNEVNSIDKSLYTGNEITLKMKVESNIGENIYVFNTSNGQYIQYDFTPYATNNITLNISNVNIIHQLTVCHKYATGSYLVISSPKNIPVIQSIVEIYNVYDIKFIKDHYFVNENIELEIEIDDDVNSFDNLLDKIKFDYNIDLYVDNCSFVASNNSGRQKILCIIKAYNTFINSCNQKFVYSANDETYTINDSIYIYPKVDSAEIELDSDSIYENGSSTYKKTTINIDARNVNGNNIPVDSLYNIQYLSSNDNLINVSNNICQSIVDKVGKTNISVTVEQFENGNIIPQKQIGNACELTVKTLPISFNCDNHIDGYTNYTTDVEIVPNYKSTITNSQYKSLDGVAYKYILSPVNNDNYIYIDENTVSASNTLITINNFKIENGIYKIYVDSKYNNISKYIIVNSYDINSMDIEDNPLYIKGGVNTKFIQQFKVNTKSRGIDYDSNLGSLGENYYYTISRNGITTSNKDLGVLTNSMYNTNTLVQYDLGEQIGSDEFTLNTKVNSISYIPDTELLTTQQVIPIKINGLTMNDTGAGYIYNTVSDILVNGPLLIPHTCGWPKKTIKMNLNHNFTEGTSDSILSYTIMFSYTLSSSGQMYIHYSNQAHYSQTNSDPELIVSNFSASDNMWIGHFHGIHYHYIHTILCDEKISNILEPLSPEYNNQKVAYVGIIPWENNEWGGRYVIPITKNIYENNEIKTEIDKHIISQYTNIETYDYGSSSVTPNVETITISIKLNPNDSNKGYVENQNNFRYFDYIKLYPKNQNGNYIYSEGINIVKNGQVSHDLEDSNVFTPFRNACYKWRYYSGNTTLTIGNFVTTYEIRYKISYNNYIVNGKSLSIEFLRSQSAPINSNYGMQGCINPENIPSGTNIYLCSILNYGSNVDLVSE